MRWARWDRQRHTLTVVTAGGTRTVLADLSPSFSVQFTPPVDGTPSSGNGRLWSDSTGRVWSDSTDREWAA